MGRAYVVLAAVSSALASVGSGLAAYSEVDPGFRACFLAMTALFSVLTVVLGGITKKTVTRSRSRSFAVMTVSMLVVAGLTFWAGWTK